MEGMRPSALQFPIDPPPVEHIGIPAGLHRLQPLQHSFLILVGTVFPERLNQIFIAGYAASVFGRTGTGSIKTDGKYRAGVDGCNLFNGDVINSIRAARIACIDPELMR